MKKRQAMAFLRHILFFRLSDVLLQRYFYSADFEKRFFTQNAVAHWAQDE
jgi:hypothetical protein